MRRNAAFERTIDEIAAGSDATVLSVETSYETRLFSRTPERVVRVVATQRQAERLTRDLQEFVGADVDVYVLRENATGFQRMSGGPLHEDEDTPIGLGP